jgi:membrane fusion protein (multidrug efflux system)
MLEQDDRDAGEVMLAEVPSAGAGAAAKPYQLRYQFRAPADGAVGLLERPDEPAVKPPRPTGESDAVEPDKAEHEPGAGKARKGFLRRRPLAAALGFILLSTAGAAAYVYWDEAAHFQSTDDAFVAARQFSIAPQVAGYVTAVPVTDNEHVAAGQVIARIDDRTYRAALEQAEAQVAAAQSAVRNVDAQMDVQQAQISANQAQVNQAQANLELAQVTWGRDKPLVNQGWTSAQQGTIDVQNLKAQQSAVDNAQATLTLAQRQMETLTAQRASAAANVKQTEAQRDQARLNLSYTTVVADQPGHVANLSAAVGEYVSPGTALSTFVPDDIWVTANFKETQLDHMRPGQPVTIAIDAYPDRAFRGHVASVQLGSGTAFSLLPPENATGNYVKIVQRVPVKIAIDNPPADIALGPGMSVVPTVRVDPAPFLYQRLAANAENLWEAMGAGVGRAMAAAKASGPATLALSVDLGGERIGSPWR